MKPEIFLILEKYGIEDFEITEQPEGQNGPTVILKSNEKNKEVIRELEEFLNRRSKAATLHAPWRVQWRKLAA